MSLAGSGSGLGDDFMQICIERGVERQRGRASSWRHDFRPLRFTAPAKILLHFLPDYRSALSPSCDGESSGDRDTALTLLLSVSS